MPHYIDKALDNEGFYTLGDYHIEHKLGKGNMGVVYKATHMPRNTVCAIKILNTKVDKVIIQRFQREALSIKRLKHINIVQVYDCAKINDLYVIAMEFIAGETLDVWLKKNTFFSARLKMFKKIVLAVYHAHSHQLIHRDIKPANIMVRFSGEPCVMDFGLVKDLRYNDQITATGMVMGTPMYMSPEQLSARNVDYRTDVYSLGVILYEMITNSRPFGSSLAETLYAKSTNILPQVQNIEENLYAICCKALAFRRNRRYANAKALLEDIKRYEGNKPVHALEVKENHPWRNATVAIMLLSCMLLMYFVMSVQQNSVVDNDVKKPPEKVTQNTEKQATEKMTPDKIDTFLHKTSLLIARANNNEDLQKVLPLSDALRKIAIFFTTHFSTMNLPQQRKCHKQLSSTLLEILPILQRMNYKEEYRDTWQKIFGNIDAFFAVIDTLTAHINFPPQNIRLLIQIYVDRKYATYSLSSSISKQSGKYHSLYKKVYAFAYKKVIALQKSTSVDRVELITNSYLCLQMNKWIYNNRQPQNLWRESMRMFMQVDLKQPFANAQSLQIISQIIQGKFSRAHFQHKNYIHALLFFQKIRSYISSLPADFVTIYTIAVSNLWEQAAHYGYSLQNRVVPQQVFLSKVIVAEGKHRFVEVCWRLNENAARLFTKVEDLENYVINKYVAQRLLHNSNFSLVWQKRWMDLYYGIIQQTASRNDGKQLLKEINVVQNRVNNVVKELLWQHNYMARYLKNS